MLRLPRKRGRKGCRPKGDPLRNASRPRRAHDGHKKNDANAPGTPASHDAPKIRRGKPPPPALAILAASLATAAEPEALVLGQSLDARPIVARVHGPVDAPETLLVIASIHGSEPAGTPLVEKLEGWLDTHPNEWTGQRVVILPVANPDGYTTRERFNRNGVDLNRNFPAGNRVERKTHGATPLSEPESRALMRALERFAPTRVVSLHQPLACVDYDGPGEKLATAMSAAMGGKLPVKKLGGRPGSLGSYVGETLGRPIVTLELPENAEERSAEELWRDYGPALVAFVRGE